jgi:hypothetical protein
MVVGKLAYSCLGQQHDTDQQYSEQDGLQDMNKAGIRSVEGAGTQVAATLAVVRAWVALTLEQDQDQDEHVDGVGST